VQELFNKIKFSIRSYCLSIVIHFKRVVVKYVDHCHAKVNGAIEIRKKILLSMVGCRLNVSTPMLCNRCSCCGDILPRVTSSWMTLSAQGP